MLHEARSEKRKHILVMSVPLKMGTGALMRARSMHFQKALGSDCIIWKSEHGICFTSLALGSNLEES